MFLTVFTSPYWFLCFNSWTPWLLLRKRRRLTMKTWVWQKHMLTICQPSVSITYFVLHPFLPGVYEYQVCLFCHMALIGKSLERTLCYWLWLVVTLCGLCTLVVLAVDGRRVLKIFTTVFVLNRDLFAKLACCWDCTFINLQCFMCVSTSLPSSYLPPSLFFLILSC